MESLGGTDEARQGAGAGRADAGRSGSDLGPGSPLGTRAEEPPEVGRRQPYVLRAFRAKPLESRELKKAHTPDCATAWRAITCPGVAQRQVPARCVIMKFRCALLKHQPQHLALDVCETLKCSGFLHFAR